MWFLFLQGKNDTRIRLCVPSHRVTAGGTLPPLACRLRLWQTNESGRATTAKAPATESARTAAKTRIPGSGTHECFLLLLLFVFLALLPFKHLWVRTPKPYRLQKQNGGQERLGDR